MIQAVGFVRGTTDRWPELQELAMGNDEFLQRSPELAAVRAGRRPLRATTATCFAVRGDGDRYWDIAPDLDLVEPGVSRGIAVADVDGDGALDFAVANQWAPSSFYRNQGRTGGSFLGLHLLLPVDRERAEPTRSRPGHPGGDLAGRPAIGASRDGPAAGRPRAASPGRRRQRPFGQAQLRPAFRARPGGVASLAGGRAELARSRRAGSAARRLTI